MLFTKKLQQIPQSLTQAAKVSKSLYNHANPLIFVQKLFQYSVNSLQKQLLDL